MIRVSISPMPQAACVGKTTVHVVNPLFAVHCDIVQTTEKESLLRFLLWITLKARILYESNIPSHRLDVPPSGDTAPGKTVTLPHDAMLAERRTALSAGGTNTGWYEGHDYEYQRTLTVPENELADTHILEFEGVYHNAEVWLNGQKAAFRPYGYTNFYVDCAPYLHAGENELRVIARNADQPNSRWYSGAGIYRPVQLWTARGAHIALNGVKIRTLSLDPAVVEVRVKTTAPGTVRLTMDALPTMQQESDGEAVFTLTLDNARLWTPEMPNLYTCRVSFADDEVTETFGGPQGRVGYGRLPAQRQAVHHPGRVHPPR